MMKRNLFFCFFVGVILFITSCEKYPEGCGIIRLSLSSDYRYDKLKSIISQSSTKAKEGEIPDTNKFVLLIVSDEGNVVYDGHYEDRPKEIVVKQGSYNLTLMSENFVEPMFASPQYGDIQTVYVGEGEKIGVAFNCKQINAGLKINYKPTFVEKYSGALMLLESEQGSIVYSFKEDRIAYFVPGLVKLVNGNTDNKKTFFSRTLETGKVLAINLSTSGGDDIVKNGPFTVELDTSRIWDSEDVIFGTEGDGTTQSKALSVSSLSEWVGAKEVWVKGIIVGGDVSTSKFSTKPPFKAASNLAISTNRAVVKREGCAAVELKTEKIREHLSLVSNPLILGKMLYVKGDIETYFGYPGVKNIKEYKLE